MSTGAALAVTVLLLAGNAFFVGAEFAVTSARRSQLEPLAQAGSRRATTALWALEHVSTMLATAQLGVTLCSTGLGVVAEPAIAHALAPWLGRLGLGAGAAHAVAVVVALVIVVYVHVVAGEMVPKNISISAPQTAVLWLAPPLVRIATVLRPVIHVLNGFANWVLHTAGIETVDEVSATFSAEEVANIVERSTAEGVLEDHSGLLTGALEFSEETAGSVMVPLDQLYTLAWPCTPDELEHAVATTGYSRFPVRQDDGQVIGYLHLKDVLDADATERHQPVPTWRVRALVPVPAHAEVEDALAAMQRSGAHLGRVTDAGGRTVGVVFLEDILEELVGEVDDAMQREDAAHRSRPDEHERAS